MDLFDIIAARQGGSGSSETPQVQSDWNENDSTKLSYVKNRTHWKEEVERNYTVLPNVEPNPMIGLIERKKIGLEIGKEYTFEIHLMDGTIETIQVTAIEFPEDDQGIAGIPYIVLDNICTIIDGVFLDVTGSTIIAGENCYYNFATKVVSVLEKVIIQNLPNTETMVHKIPNEYLPEIPETIIDQAYNSESENAQSGIAVEQAINEYDESLMIGTDKLADSSIDNTKIRDDAVTSEKIPLYAIKEGHLSSGAVTKDKIANANISGNKLVRPSLISSTIVSSEVASWSYSGGYAQEAVIYGKVVSSDTESTSQVFLVNLDDNIIAQATLDFSGSQMYYFMCRIKLLTAGVFLVDFSITSDMQNASPEISFSHYVDIDLNWENYIYSVNVRFGDVSIQKLAVGTEIYYYEILRGYVN